MTAYRQHAIAIARFLQQHGPSKASIVTQTLEQSKAGNILYKDVYGWFDRVSRGIYELSPHGTQKISLWDD